jgi:hypothetical protein
MGTRYVLAATLDSSLRLATSGNTALAEERLHVLFDAEHCQRKSKI